MAEGEGAILEFLKASGWADAQRRGITGDASSRSYERLVLGRRSAILMKCRHDGRATVEAFQRLALWLNACGLSAPRTFACSPAQGLILCEDFGDEVVARIVADDPVRARGLYSGAVRVLARIGESAPPAGLARLDSPRLRTLIEEVAGWYLGDPKATVPDTTGEFLDRLEEGLRSLDKEPAVTTLRDYHAGNLVLIARRKGLRRIGLLDFQDAVLAHPAYDLVSLLQDARLDVPREIETDCIRQFASECGHTFQDLVLAYQLLGMQRGLRILGVFARLARRDRKPGYLAHCSRVWAQVDRNAQSIDPGGLGRLLPGAFPAPTEAKLAAIRGEHA